MKYLFFLLMLPSISFAKEFHFTYRLINGRAEQKLEYKTSSDSWEEAFERGSQFCFDFFANRVSNLTEEKGLDITDTCVNPTENN